MLRFDAGKITARGWIFLPMDGWAEDVMGLEEPGEKEEGKHDSSGPVEELQWECGGERRVRVWLGLAKDEAAEEADSG
jgi:hypothetical protein